MNRRQLPLTRENRQNKGWTADAGKGRRGAHLQHFHINSPGRNCPPVRFTRPGLENLRFQRILRASAGFLSHAEASEFTCVGDDAFRKSPRHGCRPLKGKISDSHGPLPSGRPIPENLRQRYPQNASSGDIFLAIPNLRILSLLALRTAIGNISQGRSLPQRPPLPPAAGGGHALRQ